MIAYFSALPTALNNVIAHKLALNREKDAVLFIDERSYERREIFVVEGLKKYGIFHDVIEADLKIPFPKGTTLEEAENIIIKNFDEIFKNSGYDLNSFEQIICTNDGLDGDQNIYFNYKKIPYTWLQASPNIVPPPSLYRDKNYVILMNKYRALTPFAEYAEPCLQEKSDITITQIQKLGKKYILWNSQKCLENILEEDMKKLFGVFRLDDNFNIDNTDSAAMIIKNSYGYLNKFRNSKIESLCAGTYSNMDKFSVMDKVTLDFYAPNESVIYFKHHIHDFMDKETTEQYYGKGSVALPNVPFEVLGKYFVFKNIVFDKIIGTASTSLGAISEKNYNKFYPLGIDFAKTWWFYLSIYVSVLFAKEQGYDRIYCSEVLMSQIELLSEEMEYKVEVMQFEPTAAQVQNALIIINGCGLDDFQFIKIHKSTSVIFLNMDQAKAFFSIKAENFAPICIKKEKISDTECDILYREETIWVFSRDKQFKKAVRDFTFERKLYNLGMKIYSDGISYPQAKCLFDTIQEKENNSKIILRQEKQIQLLYNYVQNPSDISKKLTDTTDFYVYLNILQLIKSNYLIVLSVRDTPGDNISDEIIEKIHELGFTNFSNELWRMYIGVSLNVVIANKTGDKREDPVEYQFHSDKFDLDVASRAWKQGNKASVVINGKDYAVNLRGLNIVVYDVEKNQLVDSIGYDAHTENTRFIRK